MIQKDCVSLQAKIALGRPYSGDVYNAQLTQGHNKVDCQISLYHFHVHTRMFVIKLGFHLPRGC